MIIHRFFYACYIVSQPLHIVAKSMRFQSTCLFILLFLSSPLMATDDPLVIRVDYTNHAYSSSTSTTIHATPDVLFSLLTAYNELNTFSPLIEHSQQLPNGDLQLELTACFAFICFDKTQTPKLTLSELTITGDIVPEHSDFKSRRVRWHITHHKGSSQIQFSSNMEPNFWIPPLLGPLLIKHKLRKEAEHNINLLEALAATKTNAQ